MNTEISNASSTNAWYSCEGNDTDVVLSTRVRLARNLANFPFPKKLQGNDAQRIQSIVFDAVNQSSDRENFYAISVNKLDPVGARILTERGVLEAETSNTNDSLGIIMRLDGKVSCTVNSIDHVRISSFAAGLSFEDAYSLCKVFDEDLQKHIQFAASFDFGYLTSSIYDAGSGMKISFRVHLPSLSMQQRIAAVAAELYKKGIQFTACYGAGGAEKASAAGGMGTSLGACYQISGFNSYTGTEIDQAATIIASVRQVIELERKARAECKEKNATDIRNDIYRSFALAKFSKFITLREAIDIISNLKWGRSMSLLTGIDDVSLHALLYRIQEAHIQMVLKSGNFNFEPDIADNNDKKICRLRALILQEAFEDVRLAE